MNVGQFIKALRGLGLHIPTDASSIWTGIGLTDFNPDRVITRLEAAVVLDALIDPFSMFAVDYQGNVAR